METLASKLARRKIAITQETNGTPQRPLLLLRIRGDSLAVLLLHVVLFLFMSLLRAAAAARAVTCHVTAIESRVLRLRVTQSRTHSLCTLHTHAVPHPGARHARCHAPGGSRGVGWLHLRTWLQLANWLRSRRNEEEGWVRPCGLRLPVCPLRYPYCTHTVLQIISFLHPKTRGKPLTTTSSPSP